MNKKDLESAKNWIISNQSSDGAIYWDEKGKCDAWDHCECLIALAIFEEWEAFDKGIDWALSNINSEGLIYSEFNFNKPSKDFFDIQEDEWYKYYNQLFYSFVYILQNLKVNNDGYIFLISSHLIKEPTQSMSLSVSYRLALSSILKLLTKHFASKNISCINIAPGPIKTKRLESLVGNLSEFESKLPFRRAGSVEEISKFVRSIIENNIKYLSGVTINFDGGESNYIL